MKPISRLRTRARSLAGSSATAWPLSQYSPFVAESSRPRIDRSVDLPHPDGPAMDTYSPFATSRLTSESACVSTSSVRKTLPTDWSLMTGAIIATSWFRGPTTGKGTMREDRVSDGLDTGLDAVGLKMSKRQI